MTTPVFSAGDFKQIKEHRLVLAAAGIPTQTIQKNGGWQLLVRPDDSEHAIEELQDYRSENQSRTVETPHLGIVPGAAWGSLVYCFVIGSISTLAASWGYGVNLSEIGTSVAANVTSGEWYRCVTALTLHLDIGHLASNLLFGSFFGFLLGQSFGGGLAWILIVIAGFLGNLMNAYFQGAGHQSIGASTAVFGALGIMVAEAFQTFSRQNRYRKWTPILGGIMLLSFLGVGGERTDVMAHVFGFVAGIAIGFIATKISHQRRMNLAFQWAGGVAALLVVCLAWTLALRSL
ncbi:rhomboid family intramembrane serine protease [Rhodopirellula sp. MGV]|uniref:rhomboid family intramembrane serine protease n=1 Tax=Rhodopirellula sp. MGV TaxID=2023130 RepID=UPI001304705F|nr:rhomboid family intramembrane serine protease [Rhodopirellula sp. MGV]